ncbi:hypothetical protein AVEN_142945-1 [Araneus ventricosus]|uniref:Uncharacterized protein n=1 Tax=Araneus ventricosus TaxID=182803 RepID=A0A4Y2UMN5_ARAVE|nr:hypothetical protein AVEN_142945-1 [Araneus ventricosus]
MIGLPLAISRALNSMQSRFQYQRTEHKALTERYILSSIVEHYLFALRRTSKPFNAYSGTPGEPHGKILRKFKGPEKASEYRRIQIKKCSK